MKTRLVIIEDDKTVRENLLTILTEEGYDVNAAENGYAGLELIKKENPDLVICDIMMEGISGYDVLILVRQVIDKPVPFIFLTARIESEDLRKAMELGADDFLHKPFKTSELLKAIKSRLSKMEMTRRYFSGGEEESEGENRKNKKYSIDDKILLKINNESKLVNLEDIRVISADNQYSNISMKGKKDFQIKRALSAWEEMLPEESFVRIHRSTIINIRYIEKIQQWFKNSLKVKIDGIDEEFIISRRYASKLKSLF